MLKLVMLWYCSRQNARGSSSTGAHAGRSSPSTASAPQPLLHVSFAVPAAGRQPQRGAPASLAALAPPSPRARLGVERAREQQARVVERARAVVAAEQQQRGHGRAVALLGVRAVVKEERALVEPVDRVADAAARRAEPARAARARALARAAAARAQQRHEARVRARVRARRRRARARARRRARPARRGCRTARPRPTRRPRRARRPRASRARRRAARRAARAARRSPSRRATSGPWQLEPPHAVVEPRARARAAVVERGAAEREQAPRRERGRAAVERRRARRRGGARAASSAPRARRTARARRPRPRRRGARGRRSRPTRRATRRPRSARRPRARAARRPSPPP